MYYYRTFDLPWSVSTEVEQRFRKILLNTLALFLVLSLVIPWLPTPDRDIDALDEIPERFAKLILERPAPPPPPPPQQIEPEPEPEPEPEQVVEVEPEPEPIIPEPQPEPEPIDTTEQARENAAMAGLLPFVEDLADLRDSDALDSVMDNDVLSNAVVASARSEFVR